MGVNPRRDEEEEDNSNFYTIVPAVTVTENYLLKTQICEMVSAKCQPWTFKTATPEFLHGFNHPVIPVSAQSHQKQHPFPSCHLHSHIPQFPQHHLHHFISISGILHSSTTLSTVSSSPMSHIWHTLLRDSDHL
ncbi:hypothetical protein E2C01_083259 [Portunus trituberculatus]|uniref:Uncharacterized protein n=1 Tax=Portunus trituberculatus TaxID=210409 RepID=A0A5B7J5Z2_PORTR|nr:hypothetical protein [Portunus trituberculatus]